MFFRREIHYRFLVIRLWRTGATNAGHANKDSEGLDKEGESFQELD